MGEKRKVITIKCNEEEIFERWSVTNEVYDLLKAIYNHKDMVDYLDSGTFYTFKAILEHFEKKFKAEKKACVVETADFEFTD